MCAQEHGVLPAEQIIQFVRNGTGTRAHAEPPPPPPMAPRTAPQPRGAESSSRPPLNAEEEANTKLHVRNIGEALASEDALRGFFGQFGSFSSAMVRAPPLSRPGRTHPPAFTGPPQPRGRGAAL